jgi:hypothetical protein
MSRSYALLLPRDPDWAYAAWAVEVADLHAALAQLPDGGAGGTQLVLRLYAATRSGRRTTPSDRRVTGWSGTEQLVLGAPGGAHELALGVVDEPTGPIVSIARSGSIVTPSEAAGERPKARALPVLHPAPAHPRTAEPPEVEP